MVSYGDIRRTLFGLGYERDENMFFHKGLYTVDITSNKGMAYIFKDNVFIGEYSYKEYSSALLVELRKNKINKIKDKIYDYVK